MNIIYIYKIPNIISIFLYEKTRTIEDLIEYLEYYSKNKLEQLKTEIKEKEDILEAAVDKYIDKNYVSCRINWKTVTIK